MTDQIILRPSAARLACRRAADTIAAFHPSQWLGWLLYIAEILQGQTDSTQYENMLRAMVSSIERRLNEGEW